MNEEKDELWIRMKEENDERWEGYKR